jgi:hypothetical protein
MSAIEKSVGQQSWYKDDLEDLATLIDIDSTSERLMRIPPYQCEDGKFYQPGLYYRQKTNYLDFSGRPVEKTVLSPRDEMEKIDKYIEDNR